MAFCIMTLSIMSFRTMTLSSQHNVIPHNDTKHNVTQHCAELHFYYLVQCHYAQCSSFILLCWVLLCWMSSCWLSWHHKKVELTCISSQGTLTEGERLSTFDLLIKVALFGAVTIDRRRFHPQVKSPTANSPTGQISVGFTDLTDKY